MNTVTRFSTHRTRVADSTHVMHLTIHNKCIQCIIIRIHLTVPTHKKTMKSLNIRTSEAFFKIELNDYLDTLILKIYMLIEKRVNFRGDLSGISSKKLH